MQSCWVIYNGSLTSDKFKDQAELMKEAAERAGVRAELKKNYEVMMNLDNDFRESSRFCCLSR